MNTPQTVNALPPGQVDWMMNNRLRALAEIDLYEFVKQAWPVIEPSVPMVEGWAMQAIAEHLQAVTYGDIRRLIINVPQGFSKSLMTNVFWPAWEWGPRGHQHYRYISAGYEEGLPMRDLIRCRKLITSDWYKARWPIELEHDINEKCLYANTKTGWRKAVGVRGAVMGYRADRLICFPPDEVVHTEHGPMPIGDIVSQRRRIRVWSTDTTTGQTTLKPVIGWHKNPGSELLRVSCGARSVRCTPDHRFWTQRGWVAARDLRARDVLPRFPVPDAVDARLCDTEKCGVLLGFQPPGQNSDDLLLHQFPTRVETLGIREGSVPHRISNVLGLCAVDEIAEEIVTGVAVNVQDAMPWRSWTNERGQHHAMDVECSDLAVLRHSELGVSLDARVGLQDSLLDLARTLTTDRHHPSLTPNASLVGDAVESFPANDGAPVLVTHGGYSPDTYCVTVEDYHTFYVGAEGLLARNCDDPADTKRAESEVLREEALRWYSEELSTRLNDVKKSAIIIIMQRLHTRDLSGYLLSDEEVARDWTHLMLPMEFEKDRRCSTSVLWSPTGKPFTDPRTEENELAWPERFPREEVEAQKAQFRLHGGEYAVAAMLQQRPAPRGGGMFKRDNFIPTRTTPEGGTTVRGWDIAASTGRRAAWTVGFKLHRDQAGHLTILDIQRFRGTPHEVDTKMRQTAELDGTNTIIDIPQDPGAAGKHAVKSMVANLEGFIVKFSPESGDKALRAEPFASQVEAGNVSILERPWNEEFFKEAETFPTGDWMDQIDAASRAYSCLLRFIDSDQISLIPPILKTG